MTKVQRNARERFYGHWSTSATALKDAYRMLHHTVVCPAWGEVRQLDARKYTNCETCWYIQRRLRESGMMKDVSSEGTSAK